MHHAVVLLPPAHPSDRHAIVGQFTKMCPCRDRPIGFLISRTKVSRASTSSAFGHGRRTGNGHEFQAKFHWHVEDQGIRHAYIKRGTPQLNGKVERSHRSDQQEFYQLLSYKGDVDLEAKLSEWENFYNFNRPHGAFNGKTPYEALRERL